MRDRPAVLFVDDDPVVLRSLRRSLHAEARDWSLEFVLGGVAALQRIVARDFDAIVTDLHMRDLGGDAVLATTARLRPGTFRIILSGSEVTASEVDAHRVIGKPFDPRWFRQFLRDLLGRIVNPRPI